MGMGIAGFRKVKVFDGVTEGEIDLRGNFVYVEVTNNGASTVTFTPNDFPEHGSPAGIDKNIPIASGQTRGIPMAVYKFKASGAVTVVAYGS